MNIDETLIFHPDGTVQETTSVPRTVFENVDSWVIADAVLPVTGGGLAEQPW